jgi:hypothetical protein
MGNAIGDFEATIARTQEACRWKHGVAKEWQSKGKDVCGNIMEEAAEAKV